MGRQDVAFLESDPVGGRGGLADDQVLGLRGVVQVAFGEDVEADRALIEHIGRSLAHLAVGPQSAATLVGSLDIEHVEVRRDAHRIGQRGVPDDEVEEFPFLAQALQLVSRCDGVPGGLVGARLGQELAHQAIGEAELLVDRPHHRVLGDIFFDGLILHPDHGIVARHPTTLIRVHIDVLVTDHDAKAIRVDRRLPIIDDRFVLAVVAVPLPFGAVIAHEIAHVAGALATALPGEAHVEIHLVMRRLHLERDQGHFALDGIGLDGVLDDQGRAQVLLFFPMAF